MWSYCLWLAPSGNRQHQIGKTHADFLHYSNMSWNFLRISERNRAGNFLKTVPSLILPLGHHWSPCAAFPFISQVLTGNSLPDKLLKMPRDFVLPQPFSKSRQIPTGVFVQPSLLFSCSTCSSCLLANKMLPLVFR